MGASGTAGGFARSHTIVRRIAVSTSTRSVKPSSERMRVLSVVQC
jgi:hypothetical protein